MKIKTRCLPYGALPYEHIKLATNMIAKLFSEIPYLPALPKLSPDDSIEKFTLKGMPGIEFKGNEIVLKTGTGEYKEGMNKLNKAFNNPTKENLEPFGFDASFEVKYLNIIKKFKSPNACINLLGPFTVSQMISKAVKNQIFVDMSYRKLFVQSVCVRAMWLIEAIKEYCPTTVPVVILEEPSLADFGKIRREDESIDLEIVLSGFSRTIEKIKSAGAMVGVQCFKKCDWAIPIKAGVDLISFDAYNNPNNLRIIPDEIIEFLKRDGIINWGIVPVMSESKVKDLRMENIYKRLFATMNGLVGAGVPAELIIKSAMVSLNESPIDLPVIFAEKLIMIASQIGNRLSVKG